MKSKCSTPGCLNLATYKGLCDTHSPIITSSSNVNRPEYYSMYRTSMWKGMRLKHLHNQPLCVNCQSHGLVRYGEDVDHIIPHKGDSKLFYNTNNLQTLCHSCHSRKTNMENRGSTPRIPF